MAKYFFLILFSLNAFGQVQTLAEYNRSIVEKINANKKLSPKELKALRIRTGTEITSADDKSYKEGELFKLLVNATLVSFVNRNKAEEKALAKYWDQYSKLSNASNVKLNVAYLLEIDPLLFNNPISTVAKLTYMTKFIPENKTKGFFRPIVSTKCDFLASLRKTEETKECWLSEMTFATPENRSVEVDVLRKKISYLAEFIEYKKEFDDLLNTILADKELTELHKLSKYLKVIALNRMGQFKESAAEVEIIRKQDFGTQSFDILLLGQLISSNAIDKATQVFKTISDLNLEADRQSNLYLLSAFLFFERKEYQKSDFYLQKASDIEDDPLKKMNISLLRSSISLISNNLNNSEQFKKSFEEYNTLIQKNEVTDADYVATSKLGQLIGSHPNVDLAAITSTIDELKKVNFPNTLKVRVLDRLIETLNSKQKETK